MLPNSSSSQKRIYSCPSITAINTLDQYPSANLPTYLVGTSHPSSPSTGGSGSGSGSGSVATFFDSFEESEIVLAEQLLSSDIIGELIKYQITPENAFVKIKASSEIAGLKIEDYYTLLKSIYIVDASSYPYLRNTVFDVTSEGELFIKDNDNLDFLEQLIKGSEKEPNQITGQIINQQPNLAVTQPLPISTPSSTPPATPQPHQQPQPQVIGAPGLPPVVPITQTQPIPSASPSGPILPVAMVCPKCGSMMNPFPDGSSLCPRCGCIVK